MANQTPPKTAENSENSPVHPKGARLPRIPKKVLRDLLERTRGNIPTLGRALDQQYPNYTGETDRQGRPQMRPRSYQAVYQLLDKNGLLVERNRLDHELSSEIQDSAKMSLLKAVASGQAWAVKLVAESKLGYKAQAEVDHEIKLTIERHIITHASGGGGRPVSSIVAGEAPQKSGETGYAG